MILRVGLFLIEFICVRLVMFVCLVVLMLLVDFYFLWVYINVNIKYFYYYWYLFRLVGGNFSIINFISINSNMGLLMRNCYLLLVIMVCLW